jgi:putative PIN family toxin of toxin-antitoxin system
VIRAVIDTNVLVSGLLSPAGNEALILLAIHQGLLRPCPSEEIIEEYAAVLARPKFAFLPDEIAALIAMLRDRGELFHAEVSPVTSPDPGDAKFLLCAKAAGADFIITGNKRHFPETPYGTAHVVSAGELLDRITREI